MAVWEQSDKQLQGLGQEHACNTLVISCRRQQTQFAHSQCRVDAAMPLCEKCKWHFRIAPKASK